VQLSTWVKQAYTGQTGLREPNRPTRVKQTLAITGHKPLCMPPAIAQTVSHRRPSTITQALSGHRTGHYAGHRTGHRIGIYLFIYILSFFPHNNIQNKIISHYIYILRFVKQICFIFIFCCCFCFVLLCFGLVWFGLFFVFILLLYYKVFFI
jgi:hypothetical protein